MIDGLPVLQDTNILAGGGTALSDKSVHAYACLVNSPKNDIDISADLLDKLK